MLAFIINEVGTRGAGDSRPLFGSIPASLLQSLPAADAPAVAVRPGGHMCLFNALINVCPHLCEPHDDAHGPFCVYDFNIQAASSQGDPSERLQLQHAPLLSWTFGCVDRCCSAGRRPPSPRMHASIGSSGSREARVVSQASIPDMIFT